MAFALPLQKMSRCVIVVMALTPLLLLTVAATPAVIVLPFLPDGGDRVRLLITTLTSWVETVLRRTVTPGADG